MNAESQSSSNSPTVLPENAEPALLVERILLIKGTIFVGKVLCSELRIGEHVIAVGQHPLGKGTILGFETYGRSPEHVHRGENAGMLVKGIPPVEFKPGLRLFRIPHGM